MSDTLRDSFERLMDVLRSRRSADPASSYTAKLMHGGPDAIGRKIMEEAFETCLAGRESDRGHLVREMADLFYHTLVLAAFREVDVAEIAGELDRRAGMSGLQGEGLEERAVIPRSESTVRFAVPNKGRLNEPALALIKRAGFHFRVKERMLYASCSTADVLFVFVRAEDIPLMVARGAVDVGITGSDLVLEKGAEVVELLPLDFGRCRLCVAVGPAVAGEDIRALAGARVTTSFPAITADYFRAQGVEVNCVEMSGSIEVTVALGIADAVVDIVETGDSLRENNLRVFKEIGRFETVLIAGRSVAADERVVRIKRRIEGILIANKYGMLEYNIPAASLKDAEKITPGYESPTVSELDEAGWCAVKVMVEKDKIADAMDRLEAIGATALIETEIRNCRLGSKLPNRG